MDKKKGLFFNEYHEPTGCLYALIPIGLLVLFALFASFFTIPAGHAGVVTTWGAYSHMAEPGLHVKWPFAQSVYVFDLRTQKDETDAAAASRDLQVVTSTIAINYRLDGQYVREVFETVGREYDSIIIDPAVQNTFKSVTAQYPAADLITQRETVRVKADQDLAAKLAEYHIIVENFNIINFDFSPEYNAAIEEKQVAQQRVETAKQKLEQARVDAETAITAAQGQASSQAALRDAGALTPEYLQYLFLSKWNGILPSVMGGATPMLDVSGFLP